MRKITILLLGSMMIMAVGACRLSFGLFEEEKKKGIDTSGGTVERLSEPVTVYQETEEGAIAGDSALGDESSLTTEAGAEPSAAADSGDVANRRSPLSASKRGPAAGRRE